MIGFDLDCDGTNNSCINVDTPDFIGVAEPKQVVLTAGGGQLQIANTCAKNTIDGTNMDYVVCDFDTTTSEAILFNFQLPSNADDTANITVDVRFQVNAGTAGVCFDASFLDLTAGDTVDGSFTAVQGACDSTTGTNIVETASITFTSAQHSIDAGDTAYILIERDVADGTDTNANDARLIDIVVKWQ